VNDRPKDDPKRPQPDRIEKKDTGYSQPGRQQSNDNFVSFDRPVPPDKKK
jgi:hypothetical protein